MREFAKQFYKSQAWKHTRDLYAASVGGICERCKEHGLIVPGEIVHHKVHITPANINDKSITLNWDNLELLCRNCHALMHKPQKRYKVDTQGRVITL